MKKLYVCDHAYEFDRCKSCSDAESHAWIACWTSRTLWCQPVEHEPTIRVTCHEVKNQE